LLYINRQTLYDIKNIIASFVLLVLSLIYFLGNKHAPAMTLLVLLLWGWEWIDISHYTYIQVYRLRIGGLKIATPGFDYRMIGVLCLLLVVEWNYFKSLVKIIINFVSTLSARSS
jgi:hypothetical protein